MPECRYIADRARLLAVSDYEPRPIAYTCAALPADQQRTFLPAARPELPPGWQTDGSKYCGLSLSLVTARGKSTAQVVAWLPAEKSDRTDFFGEPVPLFRVRYVDGATPGFEVDLELSEVRDSLTEAPRTGARSAAPRARARAPACAREQRQRTRQPAALLAP